MKSGADILKSKYKKMDKESEEVVLRKSLIKRAKGFVVEEIVEEFSFDGGDDMKLVKKKVSTKEIPPDISAIKYLMEFNSLEQNKYEGMTDEELIAEKKRLLNLLKEEKDEN